MCAGKGEGDEDEIEKCRLSIIIPICNVERYLPQCLDSVVPQSGDKREGFLEVILVDDGSTDHSGEIADTYRKEYPCVHVIHKRNAGVAAARNDGMDAARGEWLYFMDSDDWLSPDGISLLFCAAAECPQADMILLDAWENIGTRELPWEHFGQEAAWDSRDEIGRLQRGVLYYPMDYPGMRVPLAAPWDKLYRRGFLEKNQIRFREELRVLDDMIFNMEVLGKAEKVSYKKFRVYHYRRVLSSITNRFRADRVEEDKKVWERVERYRSAYASDVEGKEAPAQAEAFEQAYFCRVIRSFAICCRLSFYHRDNGKSHREKQEYVRGVAQSDPYRKAFLQVRQENLEWRLRAVVFLVRHGMYGGVYLLYLAENLCRTVKNKGQADERETHQSPKK